MVVPGLMCEVLWSDPTPLKGRQPSKRGVCSSFALCLSASVAIMFRWDFPLVRMSPKSELTMLYHYFCKSQYRFRFLTENKLQLLVRSHEVKQEGYEVEDIRNPKGDSKGQNYFRFVTVENVLPCSRLRTM